SRPWDNGSGNRAPLPSPRRAAAHRSRADSRRPACGGWRSHVLPPSGRRGRAGERACRNSGTHDDMPNMGIAGGKSESPPLAGRGVTGVSIRRLAGRQFALLPVLAFGLAEAVALAGGVFGASGLRTPPHGSEETLASGIFFSDSL